MPLGYNFSPEEEKRLRNRLNGGVPSTQEALKVLSLRLPNVLGGHPISPDDLLKSMGGNGPGAVVSSNVGPGALPAGPQPGPAGVLASKEGGQLAGALAGAAGGFGTPNVIPGGDEKKTTYPTGPLAPPPAPLSQQQTNGPQGLFDAINFALRRQA